MAGALVSHLIQFMIKHPEAAACFVLGIFTGIILLILYSYGAFSRVETAICDLFSISEVRHFIGISISFIVGDKQLAARLEDYDEMIIPFLIKAKDHLARAGPARPGQRMIMAGSATADADRADGNV
ncbi:unnamed protein product [Pelagomonas calceolata]|uniref:Uncharacterized protein n=1 Tax=Pelagomonas calceolata TaxID=35677 RepID=A0A8J2SYD9_9STRA|nr:unnamed protein product [Pelagomonas calceolata]